MVCLPFEFPIEMCVSAFWKCVRSLSIGRVFFPSLLLLYSYFSLRRFIEMAFFFWLWRLVKWFCFFRFAISPIFLSLFIWFRWKCEHFVSALNFHYWTWLGSCMTSLRVFVPLQPFWLVCMRFCVLKIFSVSCKSILWLNWTEQKQRQASTFHP